MDCDIPITQLTNFCVAYLAGNGLKIGNPFEINLYITSLSIIRFWSSFQFYLKGKSYCVYPVILFIYVLFDLN